MSSYHLYLVAEKGAENLRIINPTWDYVPPELVSLFVTNTCDRLSSSSSPPSSWLIFSLCSGGHNPTYIYRLLAEFYSPQDEDLFSA